MKARAALLAWLAAAAAGCNPYERRDGEYNAGPVDVSKFPAPYLGTGGDVKRGGGVFAASLAWVDGQQVGYYPFPFSAAQLAAATPLAVTLDGAPGSFAAPLAYVFDPRADDPFPATASCAAPPGYVYDEQRDGIRYDEQGNVFTALPAGATYVPLVAEVPVTENGAPCQSFKSERTLVKSGQVSLPLKPPRPGSAPDALPTGVSDSKIVAWAIVDPSATVKLPDGSLDPGTHLGPQRFGWFDHYLVQYLDGGYVPTATRTIPGGGGKPDVQANELVTQTLYVPTVAPGKDATGMPAAVMTMGKPGSGYDVLEAARGTAGYSPVCAVKTFVPADPTAPPTSVAAIDQATVKPAPVPFLYCLQLR